MPPTNKNPLNQKEQGVLWGSRNRRYTLANLRHTSLTDHAAAVATVSSQK